MITSIHYNLSDSSTIYLKTQGVLLFEGLKIKLKILILSSTVFARLSEVLARDAFYQIDAQEIEQRRSR